MPSTLTLTGAPLSVADVARVARSPRQVALAAETRARLVTGRAALEALIAAGGTHYGINTGFGSLSRQRIPADALTALQRNLIRSHSAGFGAPLAPDVVRGMMLLLAASLARGASGVRPVVVETLLAWLNAGLVPVVPETGSVGASGDLAPLAHLALGLLGEGEMLTAHGREPSGAAIQRAGIAPLVLEAKEGLALINGTHLMAAQGALLVHDWTPLLDAALAATAMAIDAYRATDRFLDPRVHALRGQPGPSLVAARLRALLQGSQIIPSHREGDTRVQDAYSLRCAPAVLGAAVDAMAYVQAQVTHELGAVTDNPLLAMSDHGLDVLSAGNFHGMPLAIPLDAATIAIAHLAGISERRTYLQLAATDPESGLPPYLSPEPGLQSGWMIAQYAAAAACNEIIGLATPASVANLPTSAGMEDYNSFGPRAAAKARRALDLARHVVAIELLVASEGIDTHRPLRSGEGVEAAHAAVRRLVPPLADDRPLAPDIAAVAAAIAAGDFSPPAVPR
jgi:histidine ammonia-lyase